MPARTKQIEDAVPAELSDALVLWAESPEEARAFLARTAVDSTFPPIDKIFVAKRSAQTRTNRYVNGQYWRTSDDGAVDVFRTAVRAPRPIVDLVQWCTCDVMLSRGAQPIVAIEDTTHLVRMNLFQRFPRLARAAMLGVPSAILQGTVGLDFSKRGDVWALHRYLRAYQSLAKVHPASPALPVWYAPSGEGEDEAEMRLVAYVRLLVDQELRAAKKIVSEQMHDIDEVLDPGVEGEAVPDVPSINYTAEGDVVVRIGADPDKKSWKEKGSGQMDPYIGMILAAKYMHCFDASGDQTRRLRIDFAKLPEGFWFFKDGADADALYKRLPFEFADEVRFLG